MEFSISSFSADWTKPCILQTLGENVVLTTVIIKEARLQKVWRQFLLNDIKRKWISFLLKRWNPWWIQKQGFYLKGKDGIQIVRQINVVAAL